MIKSKIPYKDLEKHFTLPKCKTFGFQNKEIRIPRRLKKKLKLLSGFNWLNEKNSTRLWYCLEKTNPDHKRFLIKMICKQR